MAISFYDVDTTYISTNRRSSTIEALKARKVPRRHSAAAAGQPVAVAVATVMRAVATGCAMLAIGAFVVCFVPF